MESKKHDSKFSAAHKCFVENYKELKITIEAIYYEFDQRGRQYTINDLFLEKNEDLGMKFAKLLIHQVRYLYQLLNQFPHNDDIQALLHEFSVDGGCLKQLLINEILADHVHEMKLPEGKDNVHIYFAQTSTPIRPINSHVLVSFIDKFVILIVEKLQNHKEMCKLDNCIRCKSLEELLSENFDTSQLLGDFVPYIDESLNNCEDISITNELQENIDNSQTSQDEEDDEIVFAEVKLNTGARTSASMHEVYSWERYKKIVLRKYKELQKYYVDNHDVLKEKEQSVVILYCDTEGSTKEVFCASISDARREANLLQDISEEPFPVVLISNTDYNFPNTVARKRMVQKLNSSSKVGEEVTPSLLGTLETPVGRPTLETPMLFYLDTGADTGSLGYNYEIIKHFISTVENINYCLEPAVLCKFKTAKITDEEVQVFDVDQHPNWNAIGLAVLKNYRIYLDIKNNKVLIGKHEDVTENETEETFQVTFKKEIVTSSSLPTHTEEEPEL